jgi:sugar phosphate isomerase/epimerase
MPEFAVNTYSYMLWTRAETALDRLSDLGFRKFELMAHPGHFWPSEMDNQARRAFRRYVDDAGLQIVSMNMANVDLNIASTFPEMRAYSVGILESLVNCAGDLGVPGVVITPGKPNILCPAPRDRLISYFHAALETLCPIATRTNTSLWVENVPFSFLPDVASSIEAVEQVGDPTIGYVFDLANAHFISDDPVAALARIGPRLKLIHVSDTGRETYAHAPVGHGNFDWQKLPSLLASCEHAPVVLEIISQAPDSDIAASRTALEELDWDPRT